jgi:hypothetical protein
VGVSEFNSSNDAQGCESPESSERSGCMMFVESDARMLRSHRRCPDVVSMRGDASDMSAHSTTAIMITDARKDKRRDTKCSERQRIDQVYILGLLYEES